MKELQLLLGLFLILKSGACFQNTSLPCTGERSIRSAPRYYGIPDQVLRRYRPSYYRPNKQRNNSKRKQEKFAQDGLEAHNKKRRTSPHYGTKLVLDDKLCRGAQRYAEKLARRNSGLQPSRARGIGENLHHYKSYGQVSADRVVDSWYNERNTGANCKSHYSQLVWKSSVKFCMATAESRHGGFYTVAWYSRAGNHGGARTYEENVHRGFRNPCPLSRPTYQSKPRPTYQSKPTPSSSSNSGSSGTFSTFAQKGLKLHNEKRKSRPHYGTDLVLDEELTRGAQEYAELLAKRDRGLQHYGGLGLELGENLYAGTGRVGIERAVKVWFDEKDNGKHCMGHYSQLVWKGSKKFGVAQAKSRRGKNFIVARYSPAGNIRGAKYYRENVHPSFVYPC